MYLDDVFENKNFPAHNPTANAFYITTIIEIEIRIEINIAILLSLPVTPTAAPI